MGATKMLHLHAHMILYINTGIISTGDLCIELYVSGIKILIISMEIFWCHSQVNL